MKKLIVSTRVTFILLVSIFLLMLLCNMLTPLVADDFTFHFNLTTKEPIDGIEDIFPALAAHAEHHNGRLVAHFFVYVFELLPKTVFNVINALMFTLQIGLIYLICRRGKEHNNLLMLAIFCSIWVYEPAFGDVNLWLPGSCNYLWCVVFGLIFLLPFINEFLYDRNLSGTTLNILHIVVSLMAGAWLENGSAPFIFIAAALLLATKLYQKKKCNIYRIVDIMVAVVGYLSIYIVSPGEFENKSATFSIYVLRENFIKALKMYDGLRPLLIAFVVLFVIAVMKKCDAKRIILSSIFFLGSVFSNFMMTVAAYYPERCMVVATICLVIANALLFSELFCTEYKALFVAAVGVLMLLTLYNVLLGVNDIYVTYQAVKQNESYILSCKEKGIADVTVPMVAPETKYNPVSYYLNTNDVNFWTNEEMARYYGVNSILGKW